VRDGDVVILPAFGASLEEMQHFDKQGVTVVDTTCPWVSKVWNAVDKHKAKSLTSVIHGKWQHEEAIATASMCENYIIVKNIDEAEELAAYILGEPGALSDEELLHKYRHAVSKGFEPKKHLRRVGVANQTTMYKKETQAIGRLLEKTMMAAHGPENIQDNFAAFDTICDATQVRQDAIAEMTEGDANLDLILVVGLGLVQHGPPARDPSRGRARRLPRQRGGVHQGGQLDRAPHRGRGGGQHGLLPAPRPPREDRRHVGRLDTRLGRPGVPRAHHPHQEPAVGLSPLGPLPACARAKRRVQLCTPARQRVARTSSVGRRFAVGARRRRILHAARAGRR